MQEKEEENKKFLWGSSNHQVTTGKRKKSLSTSDGLKKNPIEFEKSSSIINSLKLGERDDRWSIQWKNSDSDTCNPKRSF
jgi:hypothetical protein